MISLKKLHILIVTYLGLLFLVPTKCEAQTQNPHPDLSGGKGVVNSPYIISTAKDLVDLSYFMNNYRNKNMVYYYELSSDIDMSGIDFTPIFKEVYCYHQVSINGNNHTIKNLKIAKGNRYCGLFGYVSGSNLYFKNLNIENVSTPINASGDIYAGALVGYCDAQNGSVTFENCKVSGQLSLETYSNACIGGLVGFARSGIFIDCKNYAHIKVANGIITNSDLINGIGGIVGYLEHLNMNNYTMISRCSNHGNITGPYRVGGIVGHADCTTISKCNNSGRISIYNGFISTKKDYAGDYAGGIAGSLFTATVDFCTNIGAVSLIIENNANKTEINSKYIGGIVGYNEVFKTVFRSYSLSDNLNAGYIAGWDYTAGISGFTRAYTYNNVNIAPVFDGSAYIQNCKSGANSSTYCELPVVDIKKNDLYGGGLYDKQMSILTDSMNGKVFEGIERLAELYTSQMLYDSVYYRFIKEREVSLHNNKYDWIYNENQYAVPNDIDPDFNILASLVLTLDTTDRINDVNHQFQILILPTEENELTIESASNNKICKIAGNSVGLVALGADTIRISYKGMLREIPLIVNSVDTLMFSGGSGTMLSPYLISCLNDLKELEFIVKNNNHDKFPENNWSYNKHFKVIANIDEAFTGSIGSTENKCQTFQGIFDGNGKRITIDRFGEEGITALFTTAKAPCIIKNLEVNGRIKSCENASGLIGYANNITIDSCLNSVNIWATDTIGGITAIAYDCNISNCGNNGLLRSNKLSGGIAGFCNNCVVNDIVNAGSVLSSNVAGGLIGSSPNSTINTGVNYGYTGRTINDISKTKIGYTIGEKNNSIEKNTYWNAQTNTIWDETWQTEGLSTNQMLTDASFKEKLGKNWHTDSETELPAPKALNKFESIVLLRMPYTFTNEWNTLKDINEPIKIPGENFIISAGETDLGIMSSSRKLQLSLNGLLTPIKFGSDTVSFVYYYNGWQNRNVFYNKIVPVFISKGFAGGGNGTAESPYLINNSDDFEKMVSTVNDAFLCVDTLRNPSWHKHFKQTKSFDLTITEPIGSTTKQRYEWSGHYDGNGNIINVDIKRDENNTGIFSCIAKGGSVKNVIVTGSISANINCGSIAGCLKDCASISGCTNRALITGNTNIGGIAGVNTKSNIYNCINGNTVNGIGNVGGICGNSQKAFNYDLLNTGRIEGNSNIGGIIGKTDSSDVRRAVNAGLTKGKRCVGGITGLYLWNGISNNLIFQCMNYGYVDKEADNVGALVGKNTNNHATNVTLSFYNNQLTLAKGIDGEDNEGFSSGLLTKELLGDNLYLKLDENWKFSSGRYPMPSCLQGNEVLLAKNPILLSDEETYINLGTDFDVVNEGGTEWSSSLSKVTFDGILAKLNHSGIDTLVVSKDGIRKEQPIFITNGLFSGGNGKKEYPYRITCKKDLEDLALYVNSNMLETENDRNWSDGKFFSLENNIPEDSVITKTIAKPDSEIEKRRIHFGGTFLGHGHKIKVNISGEEDNVGLFGYINNGRIDSLMIYGSVKGTSNVGAIAGYSENGIISNCQNAATVVGNNDAGGICGYVNEGTVSNCNNAGDVISTENKAGGIAAEALESRINGCVNIAIISAFTSNSFTGGICGRANRSSNITDCMNAGIIIGENRAGGIIGETNNNCRISNCIVVNDLDYKGRAIESYKGYICGLLDETSSIKDCFVDTKFNTLNNAQDDHFVNKQETKDIVGSNLSNSLSNKWIFENNRYPRPNNDTIALLASSPCILKETDTKEDISDDFEAYTHDNCTWTSIGQRIVFDNSHASLKSMGQDTLVAYTGKIEKKIHVNITCLTVRNTTTVSGCDSVLLNDVVYTGNISFIDTFKNVNGCDSIVSMNVIVNKSNIAPEQPIIYSPKDTIVYGILCTKDTIIIHKETNAAGCDGIIKQVVDIKKTKIIETTITPGCDSTLFDGIWYKTDTTLIENFKDKHKRDTLIKKTSIVVNHTKTIVVDTLKGYDSLLVNNILVKKDTVLIDSSTIESSGCYLIRKTPIIIGKTIYKTLHPKTFCGNTIHYFYLHDNRKIEITESTSVFDTISKSDRQLEIEITDIDIKQPEDTTIVLSNCDYIIFNDIKYTESTKIDTVMVTASGWCDSTIHYVLNVLKPTYKHDTIRGCYEIAHKGDTYTESTSIYDTLPGSSHQGCDSIVATHIIINKATYDTLHTYGLEEKVLYGKKIITDTIFIDTLTNTAGCDSFVATQVHITHFKKDTITKYGCDSLKYEGKWFSRDACLTAESLNPKEKWDDIDKKWQTFLSKVTTVFIKIGKQQVYENTIDSCDQITFNGKIYTESTVLKDTFRTISNCDSIVVHNLILHKPKKQGYDTIIGCGEAIWRDVVYTKDTTFADSIVTPKWGCDSICNVTIIISKPDTTTLFEKGCGSVVFEGETFTESTDFERSYKNKGGCDSTVFVHIIVNQPSDTLVTYEGEYEVIFNGRKYTRSTVFHDTLKNVFNCDSVITIAIIVAKSLDYPIIVNKYDYMLICNNNIGSDKYVSHQWYKNGKPLLNETKPYLSENEGQKLEGCYQVYVQTTDGNEYFSEEICIEKSKVLVLYPNPVNIGEPIKIDYDFTDKQKKGLYYDIYNSTGIKVYSGAPTEFPFEIPNPNKKGYYFVLITTGEDKNLGTKFIVK